MSVFVGGGSFRNHSCVECTDSNNASRFWRGKRVSFYADRRFFCNQKEENSIGDEMIN